MKRVLLFGDISGSGPHGESVVHLSQRLPSLLDADVIVAKTLDEALSVSEKEPQVIIVDCVLGAPVLRSLRASFPDSYLICFSAEPKGSVEDLRLARDMRSDAYVNRRDGAPEIQIISMAERFLSLR